jgi:TonB-linked SusC/RagA family outer membrane protein
MQFKALCNRKGFARLWLLTSSRVGQNHSRLFNQTLRVMRLTAIILLVSVLHVSATGVSQTVTLKARNVSLEKLFNDVTTQTGYYFFYRPGQLKGAKPVTITAEQVPLDAFLQQVFKEQPVTYLLQNQTIFIVVKTDTAHNNKPAAPPVTIQGEVRDSIGNVMRGATVQLYPGNSLSITNKNGEFVIHGIEPGRYVLRVSYVGFETTSQPINVTAENNAPIKVVLKPEASNLTEITVFNNGYQTLARERSAGSFSKPKMDIIYNRSTSMDIMQRLDGQVPGLVINNAPNSGSGNNAITVRGTSTINADKSLLYVVDGVVVTDLSDINPNDVQDVTLLKDATAASIWGSRASNGVIVVVTKKGSFGANKLKVEYNGFYNMQGKPDIEYLPYMRSLEYIQTMKDLFADPAYLTANTYASANTIITGNNPVGPHEQILYKQYRGLISEATANAQLDSLAALDNLKQIKDIWYRNASLSNHTVSVRGGFGNYSIYGSLAYTNNTSSTPGEKNNSYKINIRQDVNVSKRVTVYMITNLVNTITGGANPISITNRFYPYQLFKDADGNSISMPWIYRTDSLRAIYETKSGVNLNYNPIDEMNYSTTKGNTFHANITSGITVKLVKGLRFEGVYGLMNGNSKTTVFDSQKSFAIRNQLAAFTVPASVAGGAPTYYLPTTGGKLATTNLNQRNYTVRNQLVYDLTAGNGDHQLTLLAGQEATSSLTNTNTSVARGYDPQLLTSQAIDYAALITGISGTVFPSGLTRSTLAYDAYSESETMARTTSLYGNAAYTYLRKYTINASARNDKSNLFGKDKSVQYKPLWAVGLAWQVSKEPFMERVMWIDNLTLRATYGLSGNQPSKTQFIATAYDIYNGIANIYAPGGIGYSISSYANRKLAWESTKNYNVGIDYSFLKGRLSGSTDVYMRRTTNLIGSAPANAFTGVATITSNLGNINNTGVETRLSSVNVKSRDFTWSTTLILSYNTNKVTKLYVAASTNNTIAQLAISGNRYVEGYSSFAQWAYKFKGLDNVGDPLIELADGTITKKPGAVANDLVYMGTWQPPLTGGFSNYFRYRNFQLTCNMVYDFGSKIKRDAVGLTTATGSLAGRTATSAGFFIGNLYREFNDRWKKTGDETTTNIPAYIPSSSTSNTQRNVLYYASGDLNFFDGAYIKMRDINLSYTIPAQIAARVRAEDITFRATLSNVMLWKANKLGIDPEFQNSSTAERGVPFAQHSVALGVNLRF